MQLRALLSPSPSPSYGTLGRLVAGSRPATLALALSLALLPAVAFSDVAAEEAAAAELVETLWYEGLPYEEASQLAPAGSDYLAALLLAPDEERQHANAVLAIGMAGHPGAYEALAAYANANSQIDRRRVRRALRVLPQAMGHLARQDPRALAWLQAEEAISAAHGDLARRERIWTSIGMAGTAAADAALVELEANAESSPRNTSAFARARAICGRVAHEGAAAVFGDRAAR